jgi:hypothetical protein
MTPNNSKPKPVESWEAGAYDRAAAIARRQDYLGPLDVLLFGIAIPDDGLQPKAIPRHDGEADCCSHARSMNCFAYLGNPLNASDH